MSDIEETPFSANRESADKKVNWPKEVAAPLASPHRPKALLFPHTEAQIQHQSQWRERLVEWVANLDKLVVYFNKLTELERVHASKIEKLSISLVKDTGLFTPIYTPLSEYNEKVVNEGQLAQKKIQEKNVKSLLELRSFAWSSLKVFFDKF
jgi:hypothetical protein